MGIFSSGPKHLDTTRPTDGGQTANRGNGRQFVTVPKATDRPAQHRAPVTITISVRSAGAR